MIVISACKNEDIIVSSFTASQGTQIGVVRLTYEPVADVEAYEIQRKNPQTNTWEKIGYIPSWVPNYVYDDHGIGLQNNTLISGQIYEYRIRTFDDKNGTNSWSAVVTGYIFAPLPRISKLKYVPDAIPGNDGVFTFTIKDPLPSVLSNLTSRSVKIYRSKATTSNFAQLYLNNSDNIKGNDSTIYVTCNDDNADAPYDYKFEISYNYTYAIVDQFGSNLTGGQGKYIYASLIISGDDIGGDSIETISYNVQNYNDINSSSTGAKNGVMMCKDGTNAYLGYLDDYNGLDGNPVIMKNSGSSWTAACGNLPSELINDHGIDNFDFTVSAGIIYLSTVSSDSMYVYKNDGTWSANMTTTVLLGSKKPDYLNIHFNIAVLSNELYATVIRNDTIKMFKYQGTDWIQTGGVVATGFLTNAKLEEIDGTLYLWYEEWQDGSEEITLHIKHWNGSLWVNDLQWTFVNGGSDFEVVKTGSSLYFKCESGSDGLGGIYKVTSTTTVSNLFEGFSLLITPISITSDASGNIIITVISGTSVANFQLGVYVYEGSQWKKVKDDFSQVSLFGNSNAVQAINNDIHFVYGLKSSESGMGLTTFQAKKYSK
jgi:hypothetical protein